MTKGQASQVVAIFIIVIGLLSSFGYASIKRSLDKVDEHDSKVERLEVSSTEVTRRLDRLEEKIDRIWDRLSNSGHQH